MSYQVLARKWRPKSFADLVGQEHVVRALGNALDEQRVHHAYLLTGTRGVGKTTIARILAKSLNCEEGVRAEACGVCPTCQQIEAGRFVDLLEIDAASHTGIDNIREVIENAQYAPSNARFKVYIIDEVHMLSRQAFNAILKTLEEPPAHVKFILATTDPQKVPVTVLSRCLQFSLRNMTAAQVSAHLAHVLTVENIAFETGALSLLARAAKGSMRDALSLLDQAIAYGLGRVEEAGVRAMLGVVDRRHLFVLADYLLAHDAEALLAEGQNLALSGASVALTLDNLALLFYQIAVAQQAPHALLADEDERADILALASRFSPEDAQLYYQIALQARQNLAFAPDELTALNMCLLRMLAFSPSSFANLVQTPAAPVSAQDRLASIRSQLTQKGANHASPKPDAAPASAVLSAGTSPAAAAPKVPPPSEAAPPQGTDWEGLALHFDTLPEARTAPKVSPSSSKISKQAPIAPISDIGEMREDAQLAQANAALIAAAQDDYFSEHVIDIAAQAASFGRHTIGQSAPMRPHLPSISPENAADNWLQNVAENQSTSPNVAEHRATPANDATPANSVAWAGDWAALLSQLSQQAGRRFDSARATLAHAEFLRCEGGEFWLKMQNASLASAALADKLGAVLSQHFGKSMRVRFEIGSTQNTPSAQLAQQNREKHAAALAQLAENPCVLALKKHFQAEYRQGSLQLKNSAAAPSL